MIARGPAAAFTWEFRQRHRWGLLAVAAYLLVLGISTSVLLEPGEPFDVTATSGRLAAFVIVPFTSTFLYFVAVFSYGLAGDLAARHSLYPARMFTLPVSNAALVGWPMLLGASAMMGMWLATALLALRPAGIDVPLLWPALFAAVFLAWTQVLTWAPYGLRGLRVIAAVLWLAVADIVGVLAIHYHISAAVMTALLLPQLPLAYLAARLAIARARRGDTPDWRMSRSRAAAAANDVLDRKPFASAARAQVWFEWQRVGRSLPGWVAILVPLELALLFIGDVSTTGFVVFNLILVMLTPPVMAAFAAPPTLTPFMATRPLGTAALIAARLEATLWSTLAAWLLIVIAVPIALLLSDTWSLAAEPVRRVIDVAGKPRALVLGCLLIAGLVGLTWKQQLRSMYVGLSGRPQAVKASVFLTLALVVTLVPLLQWLYGDAEAQAALWDVAPQLLAGLAGLKMALALWVVLRLDQSRVVSDRTLLLGAASWTALVIMLYGVLVWLVDTDLIARHMLMLFALLAIPLVRLSAAPLALAWNRHR